MNKMKAERDAAAEALAVVTKERDVLRAALETSMVAIDDWLHLYASELCDADHVAKTRERIAAAGAPLAYIAETQERNHAALLPARGEGEGK